MPNRLARYLALVPFLVSAQQTRPERLQLIERFEGAALDPSWSVLNPDRATVEVSGGSLRITPTTSGLAQIWFQDAEGVLVHRSVTGDFTATTRVHARAAGSETDPPPPPYRLGGILARSPASVGGARDSVHVALGSGVIDAPPFAPVCAEDKTTNNSSSNFMLHPIDTADGELRLRRRGASFELAYREIGATQWTVLRTHARPDMPATLQVGLMAYSAPTPANLEVEFERFVLAP